MNNSNTALVGEYEVTVQALRVNGKKMTLQFFRQIPQVSYFLDAAAPDTLLVPWGRVVYPIANEGREWLLAQRNDTLVRCCIDLPSTSERFIEHHTNAIAEAKEKIKRYANAGKNFDPLTRLEEGSLDRHTMELRISWERLDLARKQIVVLSELQRLGQLYIA